VNQLAKLSVYDVNTHLKNDAEIQSIAGKVMSFAPIAARNGESAPFVVYFYSPSVPNPDAYWMRKDNIRYSIFDTDVDRLFKISERILELLGKTGTIAQAGGVTGSNSRILSSYQTGSSLAAPLELNGWYRMNLDFKICNV
jgi:hypothetical protein